MKTRWATVFLLVACAILAVSTAPVDASTSEGTPTIDAAEYSNKVVEIAGTAVLPDNTPVMVELLDSNGGLVAEGLARVSEGKYSLKLSLMEALDGDYTVSCLFTPLGQSPVGPVKGDYHFRDPVLVTGVEIVNPVDRIEFGESHVFTHRVSPAEPDDPSVVWSVDDPSVLSIGQDGKVVALAVGTAKITVTTTDGGFIDTCDVEVYFNHATSVTLDVTEMDMLATTSRVLTATVGPEDATDPSVVWSSSNDYIATVDQDGRVKALRPGTAVITVASVSDDVSATCTVTVTEARLAITSAVCDGPTVVIEGVSASADGSPVHVDLFHSNGNLVLTALAYVSDGAWSVRAQSLVNLDGMYTVSCLCTPLGEAPAGPVEAVFELGIFDVTYDSNGGDVDDVIVRYGLGQDVDLSRTAGERELFDFAGWSASPDATEPLDEFVVESDTILYAVWTPVVIPVVEIDQESVRLYIDDKTTLSAKVVPEGAVYDRLVWTTSNDSVAVVGDDGTVTAVGRGTATISVSVDDWGVTTECIISVLAPASDVDVECGVEGGIAVVDLESVTDAISNSEGPVNIVVSTSGQNSVKEVLIDSETFKALADADASVTFDTANGTVTLDPETVASLAGEGAVGISIDPRPVLTEHQHDSVGSDHASFRIIVHVDGGDRSTFGNGMIDVVLPYDMDGRDSQRVGFYHVAENGDREPVDFEFVEGGISATLRHLSVYSIVYDGDVNVTGVELNKSRMDLLVGGVETLIENVLPSAPVDRSVLWSSSDPSVASVDFKGMVMALKVGTATITVTTVDGGFTATCLVVVTAPVLDVPVTGVTLDRDSVSMTEGDRIRLVATVVPSDATVYGVVWSSSDTSVVKVDSHGNVTAIGAGTATITVTTIDGGCTDTCQVTVESVPEGGSDMTLVIVAAVVAVVAAALVAVMVLRSRAS